MTRYMLDANIISDLIRNPEGKAAKKIATAEDDARATGITIVTANVDEFARVRGVKLKNWLA